MYRQKKIKYVALGPVDEKVPKNYLIILRTGYLVRDTATYGYATITNVEMVRIFDA